MKQIQFSVRTVQHSKKKMLLYTQKTYLGSHLGLTLMFTFLSTIPQVQLIIIYDSNGFHSSNFDNNNNEKLIKHT